MALRDHLLALRPKQWTKNGVVLAAFLFALGDSQQQVDQSLLWTALQAVLVFCLAASSIYLLNDVRDRKFDQAHPFKKLRPVAAGKVKVPVALLLSLVLLVVSLWWANRIAEPLLRVIGAYVVMQWLYTFFLKKIIFVDLFIIAFGFVLRALAGAVAIQVYISPWLLICTLLLALFLALCKRRHERVVVQSNGDSIRPSLEQYEEKLLDQLIAIVSASTIISYALYTLWPDTVEKFGTYYLGLTIPFVLFGIFRYLDLVYRHDKGGQPEQILLTDLPLLLDILLYGVSVVVIVFYT